jgi:hypothetical protein
MTSLLKILSAQEKKSHKQPVNIRTLYSDD